MRALPALIVLASLTGCTVFLDTAPLPAADPEAPEDVHDTDSTDVPDLEDDTDDPDAAPNEVDEDPDPVGPDADVDIDEPDEPIDPTAPNRCGGVGALTTPDNVPLHDDNRCGVCGDGTLVCASSTSLRCVGATPPNACGGCGALAGELGESCGPCGDGQWVCDPATASARCNGDRPPNSCGGCGDLEFRTGFICDGPGGLGAWVCDGTADNPNAIVCLGAGRNACGGTGDLLLGNQPASPGTPCTLPDRCGTGVVVCDGTESVRCEGLTLPTSCGGCEPLPFEPGTPCGGCPGRTWICDGTDALRCSGALPNVCGGCGSLPGDTPGAACGNDGVTVCDSPSATTCREPEATLNACGGTAELPLEPGAACGTCNAGEVVCDGSNDVRCENGGSEARNACGGCGVLPGTPGDPCGPCNAGELVCDGSTRLRCEEPEADPRNLCGGCEPSFGPQGSACGYCATWYCAPDRARQDCVPELSLPGCASSTAPTSNACTSGDDGNKLDDDTFNESLENCRTLAFASTLVRTERTAALESCFESTVNLSPNCSRCQAWRVLCREEHCGTQCETNPISSQCLSCVRSFCGTTYSECAGRNLP